MLYADPPTHPSSALSTAFVSEGVDDTSTRGNIYVLIHVIQKIYDTTRHIPRAYLSLFFASFYDFLSQRHEIEPCIFTFDIYWV